MKFIKLNQNFHNEEDTTEEEENKKESEKSTSGFKLMLNREI